ncbi:MAG: hypothetical protein KDD45_02565 [Bdellovibrionales bacterium]|nr:hypothetical protein [Bdellovibrionales bacterium]
MKIIIYLLILLTYADFLFASSNSFLSQLSEYKCIMGYASNSATNFQIYTNIVKSPWNGTSSIMRYSPRKKSNHIRKYLVPFSNVSHEILTPNLLVSRSMDFKSYIRKWQNKNYELNRKSENDKLESRDILSEILNFKKFVQNDLGNRSVKFVIETEGIPLNLVGYFERWVGALEQFGINTEVEYLIRSRTSENMELYRLDQNTGSLVLVNKVGGNIESGINSPVIVLGDGKSISKALESEDVVAQKIKGSKAANKIFLFSYIEPKFWKEFEDNFEEHFGKVLPLDVGSLTPVSKIVRNLEVEKVIYHASLRLQRLDKDKLSELENINESNRPAEFAKQLKFLIGENEFYFLILLAQKKIFLPEKIMEEWLTYLIRANPQYSEFEYSRDKEKIFTDLKLYNSLIFAKNLFGSTYRRLLQISWFRSGQVPQNFLEEMINSLSPSVKKELKIISQ